MKRFALIVCAAISLPVHAQQDEMAFALFSRDYPALLRLAKPLASREDCSALFYLGRYFEEPHAEKNLVQAGDFYSRVIGNAQCAEQNLQGRTSVQHMAEAAAGSPFLSASAAAAEQMALLNERSERNRESGYADTLRWWRVAENYGSHDAVYRLGSYYLKQGEHERGIRYLHRHLDLIRSAYARHPGIQAIEARESNYALGKLFLDSGSGYYNRDQAISHLREAAVLGGIEASYLLALAYAQREAVQAFTEPQGRTVPDDDLKLAIVFLERAVERDVALPHLKRKRVQGQLLLADLLFQSSPERARRLADAATVLISELDLPQQQAVSHELVRLKQKWRLD